MKNILKKIISVVLSVLIIAGVTVTASALKDASKTLEDAFFEYYKYDIPLVPGKTNEVHITYTKETSDYTLFAADGWIGVSDTDIKRVTGDWCIESAFTHLPYDLGLYVYLDGNVLTIEDAVNKGIVTDLSVLNEFPYITATELDSLTKKCADAYKKHINFTPEEGTYIDYYIFGEINGYAVFRADVESGHDEPCMNSEQIIGNYRFTYSTPNGPEDNPTGLFVLTPDGEVISALKAYENGYISDTDLAKTAKGEYKNPYDPYNQYDYEEIIIPMVTEELIQDAIAEVTSYSERYYHYEDANASTPDYVLINLRTNFGYSMPVAELIGDNLLFDFSGNIPFTYGYAIFIPESNEIYDFTNALTMDIKGFEKALDYIHFDALLGDNDGDGKHTIKDATYLQKCLAGIKEFRKDDVIEAFQYDDNAPVRYISDYNRDGSRNIKDATAIQKKLAKIEE